MATDEIQFKEDTAIKVAPQSTTPSLSARAEALGIPYLDEIPRNFDKEVLKYISQDSSKKYGVVPYKMDNGVLYVAVLDPENFEALNVLRFLSEKEKIGIEVALANPDIFSAIAKQYTGADTAVSEAIISLKKEDAETLERQTEKSPKKDMSVYQDAPIAKLVEAIVQRAIDDRASDIHVEPIENSYRVRFRVDGILKAELAFPLEVGRAVISRIKILSNLKIDEKRKPQDGRIRFNPEDGGQIDLRVSSLPVMEGEKIVMRVLDKSANVADLDALGLWGRGRDILEKKIREPFGIILITGPTGSGKSTSLYAFLQILNKEERNIITLEDPVEYFLEGINQSQIKPEIGYTFASGLRSILRQDPNVIMVGEIRDGETAELAIHAALTGHLVMSTLHTNDAIGTIPRLIDMGIEPFLLASSLQAVASQRLVRRICEHCKKEEIITAGQKKLIEDIFQAIPEKEILAFELSLKQKIVVYKGKGCTKCSNTGYKGRIAIYEVMDIDDKMREVISDQKGQENVVRDEAKKQGMLSMKQDGVLKVLKGVTTLSEIERVTEGTILVDEE
ncbi:MAG: GspE/PulE family protein [Candidatus Moranbacteria bacterium]|nr:GspE/PulE family protein [Candidatus Moranbacteria bacterium]